MIPEIDTPIEYVHYSWKELKNQDLPAGARWKNRKNVGERDSSKSSARLETIPHTGNARLHCF